MKGKSGNQIFSSGQGFRTSGWQTILGRIFLASILIFGLLGWSQGLQAQEFPSRPITMMIGFQPGGSTDACGRFIADRASKILGQEITPVNKPGGGGSVAIGILAHTKGDGYTIFVGVSSPLTILPYLESVPYDSFKDVAPLIQYGASRTALVVRSDSPFNSLKDMIEFARKNPGKVSCGNPGFGNQPHLAMEYLGMEEKVNIAQVPFQGTAPTMVALLGGHVSAAAVGPGYMQFLRAGKVRVLASLVGERMLSAPDAPTLAELGYRNPPPAELYIMLAPKGTPSDIMGKIAGAFRKVMKTDDYKKLADSYEKYVEEPLATQGLKEALEKEYAKFGEIVRKAKMGK